MADKKQRLVYSVIDFLNESIADGTVKEEDKESLEVAIQCIGEAFGVDPDNEEQAAKLSIKPATLLNVFDVFLKTRERTQASPTAQAASTSAGPSSPSAANKGEADKLKQQGNALMSSKKYDEAIDAYTKAIDLDGSNPVYYSNRAAAHASKNDHLAAIGDAEQAISIDPKFVKAYSRLGHAQYSLGDFTAAVDAFERGLALEPTNANLKAGLDNAKARLASESSSVSSQSVDTNASDSRSRGAGAPPDLSALLSGLGGGPGGGGMPDLASMMNNPEILRLASQFASSGGFNDLMQNPNIADMANRYRTSGQTPSMDDLLSDPTLRNLAERYAGSGAGQ